MSFSAVETGATGLDVLASWVFIGVNLVVLPNENVFELAKFVDCSLFLFSSILLFIVVVEVSSFLDELPNENCPCNVFDGAANGSAFMLLDFEPNENCEDTLPIDPCVPNENCEDAGFANKLLLCELFEVESLL